MVCFFCHPTYGARVFEKVSKINNVRKKNTVDQEEEFKVNSFELRKGSFQEFNHNKNKRHVGRVKSIFCLAVHGGMDFGQIGKNKL